jgi:hypothetical protein
MSGDPAKIAQALAPQIGQLQQSQAQAFKSAELNPRGGGTTSYFANLPYQNQAEVARLYEGAIPGAAAALGPLAGEQATIGSEMGKLALGQEGMGQTSFQQALNALLGQRGQNVEERGQNKALAASLVQAIFGGGGGIGGAFLNTQFPGVFSPAPSSGGGG